MEDTERYRRMKEPLFLLYSSTPPYHIYELLKEYNPQRLCSVENLYSCFAEKYREYGIIPNEENEYKYIAECRSAMGKLGFIYPEIKRSMGFSQEDLGQLDAITPAGRNLIAAETVPAIQECYLRSMITPTIPVGDGTMFSPLCWVLAIMLELERRGNDTSISFPEMATIVIRSNPNDGLNETVDSILSLRQQREAAERKRIFDRELYDRKAEEIGMASTTFRDYADMNIRYLKATGMVQAKGKGITLVPEKHTLAIQLCNELVSTEPLLEIYRKLCAGSPLPTDNKEMAIEVLRDLLENAHRYGIQYSLEGQRLDTPAQIIH